MQSVGPEDRESLLQLRRASSGGSHDRGSNRKFANARVAHQYPQIEQGRYSRLSETPVADADFRIRLRQNGEANDGELDSRRLAYRL